MAIDTRTDEIELEIAAMESREPTPSLHPPGATSAGRVCIAMIVCLGLWALLLAPSLERDAEAGPVGTRRAMALAVLRPLTAIAAGLSVDRATETVERAIGRDANERPGGSLVLPPIELPPETTPRLTPQPETRNGHGGRADAISQPDPSAIGPTPAAEPEPVDVSIRLPESGNELRVAVVGDSLSQGLGPAVVELFDPEVADVLPLGRQSTGLARLDYFNWQAAMRQLVDGFRPDLVFVMLGSNDDQAQIGPDGRTVEVGTAAWADAYRDRAARFLREATSGGAHVVWVGIPVVQDRQRWEFYRRVNDIYGETAAADPLATYVDAWAWFQAKEGGYTAYLRNERGVLQEMRAGDGIHFTPTGYGYLARVAVRAAGEAFALPQQAVRFRL